MARLCLLAGLLVACGSGDSRLDSALRSAGDPGDTYQLATSSGSAAGLRSMMRVAFPTADDLASGGQSAHDAMLEAFADAPDAESDLKLAIFAWALEKMHKPSDAAVLKTFVARSLDSGLDWSPHFATHALRSLAGTDDGDTKGWYLAEEMVSASDAKIDVRKATPATKACVASYSIVGAPSSIHVEGHVRPDTPMNPDYVRSYVDPRRADIASNGGRFVHDNPEFPGEPSRQFDCAGYALRELNGGKKWWVDPSEAYRALAGAGVLVEVPESEAQPGDKVFYFANGATLPGHVAEVHRVDKGFLVDTVIVRNADGDSGLWEAEIDARYYTGPFLGRDKDARYPTHKILRWKNGQVPKTIPNPQNPLPCLPAGTPDGGSDTDGGVPANGDAGKDATWSGRDGGGPDVIDAKDTGSVRDIPETQDAAPAIVDGAGVRDVATDSPASTFSARIAIPGYSVPFQPTTAMGSNQGTYDGTIHLNNVVGIYAAESGVQASSVTVLLDRDQITGPATCKLAMPDVVFEKEGACAAMAFFSPAITNADDGSVVAFMATGGDTTLVRWGTAFGERLAGTFDATIVGTRVTGLDKNGDRVKEDLSGTASGVFDVVIQPDP